ncbi:PLP-dependent transferase, partial [Nonomuraea sp. NPDC004297]
MISSSRLLSPGRDGTLDQVVDLIEQLDGCVQGLQRAQLDLADHAAYCAERGLPADDAGVFHLTQTVHQARQLLAERRGALVAGPEPDGRALSGGEAGLRWGLATLAYVRDAMEWCSASYGQAGTIQFFDLAAQGSPRVNYERYEHRSVEQVEEQLLSTLGLWPEEHGLSVTSSGVAAYSLVESFLVRDRLRPGDKVLIAPYIYFEAAEQLSCLPPYEVVWAARYEVEDLVEDVLRHRPRCLFADPLTNTAQQRMVDLRALTERLRETLTWPLTLVVDGTMMSGVLPPDLLAGGGNLEIVYYESCSKYL